MFLTRMFQRLIRTPIAFFDLNPVGKHIEKWSIWTFERFFLGRILNRFTSDITTMDESLPVTVPDFLMVCFCFVIHW